MELPRNIRIMLNKNKHKVTKHFAERAKQRDLLEVDIKKSVINGQVIEKLYRFGFGEMFLVYCEDMGKVFHVVLVFNKSQVVLKTIYVPDNRFMADKKTRRDGDL